MVSLSALLSKQKNALTHSLWYYEQMTCFVRQSSVEFSVNNCADWKTYLWQFKFSADWYSKYPNTKLDNRGHANTD